MKKLLAVFLLSVALARTAGAQDTALTDADKLYGLSRFWQEANYNFAYFENVPHLNWDSAYQAYIPQVLATKSLYEYYRVMQKFCALLQDGHTNVYFPAAISRAMARRSFGDIKLALQNIDGKAVVVNTAMATKEVIPIGSEIIKVNGTPVRDYIREWVSPYIAQSASYIREDWSIDYLLDGFLGESVHVEYRKPDGKVGSMTLKREVKEGVAWQVTGSWTLFKLTWHPGNIARINLNSFGSPKIVDTFITALPELRKARAIIIDLRNNGGGNSGNASAILSYFTDSNLIKGSRWYTREHRAAYKAWGTYLAQGESDTSEWARKSLDYYHGRSWYDGGQSIAENKAPKELRMPGVPLVVLFGHSTASAAEDFLIMLDGLKGRATTIGQRSFASTGQPLPLNLPGGGEARICAKKDTYPDGRIFVGVGIKPDIEVNPVLDDYLKNRDVVLEKALEILGKK